MLLIVHCCCILLPGVCQAVTHIQRTFKIFELFEIKYCWYICIAVLLCIIPVCRSAQFWTFGKNCGRNVTQPSMCWSNSSWNITACCGVGTQKVEQVLEWVFVAYSFVFHSWKKMPLYEVGFVNSTINYWVSGLCVLNVCAAC